MAQKDLRSRLRDDLNQAMERFDFVGAQDILRRLEEINSPILYGVSFSSPDGTVAATGAVGVTAFDAWQFGMRFIGRPIWYYLKYAPDAEPSMYFSTTSDETIISGFLVDKGYVIWNDEAKRFTWDETIDSVAWAEVKPEGLR